ncbi:carbohydrate ABC transporter permease [Cohnella herbarum]|uniref:Carbohydrate ABC transporter permease n=1 Tax=Cohnella herbarum TaxID=2728023 RepID=A0A7Z2ZNY5_9BACL|nr:carbohydrate ABC transporter permease [Cohnella herbarum]QJD86768.1 carbohydrate ABC transporter permease [Cohnella herbarum]
MSKLTARRENVVGPTANFLIHTLFTVVSIACVVPLLLVIVISFTSETSIVKNGYLFWPEQWSLKSYDFLFKDASTVFRAYGVSIGLTLVGTLINILIMGLYAYPLSRRDLPYRPIFSFLLVFVLLFNGGTVTKYIVYTRILHIGDSYMALLLPLLMLPFYVIVMRTFFQTTIHPAILESAKIDGAGEFRIFARIIIPLSLPVFATVALFSTLNYWNDWFNALLFINDANKLPLQYLMIKVMNDVQFIKDRMDQVALMNLNLSELPSETLRMAMVVVGIGPIVLSYPFFQRFFIKGLTVGSVKG